MPTFRHKNLINPTTESRGYPNEEANLCNGFVRSGAQFRTRVYNRSDQPNTNSGPANSSAPAELKPAFDAITANDIMQHTKVMSADEYEGRGPGTKGEELTVKYLTEQYQRMGLKPGNPDGTYVQKVPLVGFTGAPTASFTVGASK